MNKTRILYIEDDNFQRRELTKLLRSKKFTVRAAATGKSGIEILKKGKFSIILCDLNMPDIDGLTVLKRAKKISPDIPLILITAHGSIPKAVKAIRMGAFHFVPKPAEINELVSIINQAIEAGNIQKRLQRSESRLKMITDTVPDIIYSLDPDGNILTISPAAKASLGYDPKDFIGKSVFDMIHPEDREMVINQLKESIRRKDTRTRTLEFRLLSKSGDYRDFEISRRLVFENGKIIRNDGIARDITERKILEQQLKEYSRDLEKKVDERTSRLEYSARQLEALNRLSNRLTRIRDENRLLDKIPEFLSKTLDFDRAIFFLKVQKGFKLRSFYFKKDPPRVKKSFLNWANSKNLKFPPYFYESIKGNKTVFIPDLNADPRWPKEQGKIIKTKAVVITPIRSAGKPVGLISGNLQYHEREVDKQDIARFETFANMVGLALDNIRAYQSLEKKVAERTESLNDANKRLKEKAKQLEYSTIELGKANIEMLAAQELLQEKNDEMQSLLDRLSDRRDELQAILNSSENAIIMVNNRGEVAASNTRIKDYFNISIDDVIGKDIGTVQADIHRLFTKPDKIRKYSENLLSFPNLDGSEAADPHHLYKNSFTTVDEKPRCITVFSGPVEDKSGSELGRLWIYTDVTKKKEADELLHKVVNASPVPLIISRVKDGRILFANDPLGDLVGTTAKELVGKKSPDFYFDPEDRKIVIERLSRDGYLKNHEVRLKRLDGSVFWALFSLVAAEIDGENTIIGGVMDIHQRREMEDALRWERNFVSAVLDTAGALVVVLDSGGNIKQFNKACQVTTGYSFEEVKGKPFWEFFIMAEELEGVRGVFENIKAGQFPNTYENYWLTKDGGKRLISWSNTALCDDKGEVEYIIATGIDITIRREAEEKLKLYKEIFMNTSDGITIISPDGKIIDRNPAHRKYSGFSDEEIYGKTPGEFVSPESLSAVDEAIGKKGSFRGEIAIKSKDGDRLDVDLSLFPILKDSGEVSLYVGMGRDISERKKAEVALRVSEERFRSLVENATDIIFSMTADGTVTYLSPQFEDSTGYEISDYIGAKALELMHPDDRNKFRVWLAGGARQGEGQRGFEYRIRHKNGTWRWFESNSSVLRDENGEITEIIGIAHDITEMRRILEDLEKANKILKDTQTQLVQSEKMASLGMLVAGIAHEINTPVGAVSSMHDTLMRSIEKLKTAVRNECHINAETYSRLQSLFNTIEDANSVIDSGATRVSNIVKRLRSFARLDEAELKEVDLHEGIEDTLTLIYHEIKHKAKIVKNFGDIPRISCYPGRMNQVFLNLLVNSTQAIRENGVITISTRRVNDKIVIEFEDNGVGIDRHNLSKIFDPGFTTKGVGIGTGLGLSICYQIIQDHHGNIKAESEPGKGTKFTITLPINLEGITGNGADSGGKQDL
ncbi:MAG: PAS domain S-box protein [Candidatus Zixiibacteriota bacterium]|nr:MAG: PAS domain S-box protein [candidate division Zixibacteria bacterium]